MKVTIYAHGTLAESHWRDACAEYVKRLTRLWPLTIVEAAEVRLPQNPSEGEIARALAAEAKTALSKISPRAYVIALCIEGEMLTSPALSKKMEDAAAHGASEIVFLIGSSYGMDESLKRRADLRMSFSRMTFPHQLARVMLCEQIYRAAQIAHGAPYHK